ncbi:sensor histidine kinase [Streptomyces sp. JJ66]|uniref:sensor histidine kinase n=1 Tax=Streptomyces sp. JJ66 TaxID=2803843 RepID=UPI001C57B554|nr:sensor histidine kinase [Streptomyces sp. JJ66]MBW1600690.1 sensor histidine kinase [Streptomyces sp. JJ66]
MRLLSAGLHGLFAVLLVVALAASGPVLVAPGVLLGAVYAAGVLDARRGPSRRRALAWLAAVSLLWLALLAVETNFSYLAFPLFFLYLHLLTPRWALPAVAAATSAVVAAQLTGAGGFTPGKVVGPVAGAAVAVLTAWGYTALYRESRARQRLIDDLVRARDELAASQREAGRLAERARLAREIHDTLAQGLSSIVLLSRAAASALPDGPQATAGCAAAREHVREAERTATENLAEARRFVHALTPPALADTPLPEALRRVTRTLPGPTRVDFRLEGEPAPLPVETEVALLRLTQEALANVARHAHARHATVTLAFHEREVTLDVYDDGTGFTPQPPPSRQHQSPGHPLSARPGPAPRDGFGLHGMRERIAELGGSLSVESAPGEGTAVAAALPLRVAAPVLP